MTSTIPLLQSNDEIKAYLKTVFNQDEQNDALEATVKAIICDVKTRGDQAICLLAEKFGDEVRENLRLSDEEIQQALGKVSKANQHVLEIAAQNIQKYGDAVVQSLMPVSIEQKEFTVGMDYVPVSRVACYVPGGKYPLPSTALMTAMTAKSAGVKEIIMLCPQFTPEVIYAGSLASVSEYYQLGGAQAVAAAAYGTESITKADMITGPGNSYVTEAKRQLQGTIGIDMLAGPSEVTIIADSAANPEWLAYAMLAQSEHGPDSRSILLTDDLEVAQQTQKMIDRVLEIEDRLPVYISESLGHSAILLLNSLTECAEYANQLAPEHLELQVAEPEVLKEALTNYGALFMGYTATVAMGDYLTGANHTLPTNQNAKFTGGLTPFNFLKTQSWVKVKDKAPELCETTAQFAGLEGLWMHAESVSVRK